MSHPNFVILYVDDPPRSADFYATLLGRGPADLSATFAMFALESGVMLGRDGHPRVPSSSVRWGMPL